MILSRTSIRAPFGVKLIIRLIDYQIKTTISVIELNNTEIIVVLIRWNNDLDRDIFNLWLTYFHNW